MILSFPKGGKWSVTITWSEVQGSLASSVSLLFPGSLLYTERSFREIHYSVSISEPKLLEAIIRTFKITQLGKGAIYKRRVRNIFVCWDYYLDVRRAKIYRNTTLGSLNMLLLAWFGHVHRMPDNNMVRKVYEWSPALTRSLGRSKNRWEDDVKSDITRMKINWKDCIRNWTKWKKLVEKAKTSLKL